MVALLTLPLPLAGGLGAALQSRETSPAFQVVAIEPCEADTAVSPSAARAGFRGAGLPHAAMVTPGRIHWQCATLAQLVAQAYTSDERPLKNVTTDLRPEDGFQPTYVRGGPAWVTRDRFTIEAKVPPDLTTPVLGKARSRALTSLSPGLSHALRVALEDRFELRVELVTEPRTIYSLTIAGGGLDTQKVTTPLVGDCQTIEQYSATQSVRPLTVAELVAAGNPRICGRVYSGSSGRGYIWEYTSVTFGYLARFLSSQLDRAVVDRTGTSARFNFVLPQGSPGEGKPEEHFARALAGIGLKLELVKAPVEQLVILRAEPLR
jgi:uncharacterized protein (TIGR03435 family)